MLFSLPPPPLWIPGQEGNRSPLQPHSKDPTLPECVCVCVCLEISFVAILVHLI
ncbi:rCG53670 [Rattus norvegicus]|uniref:RCG53670 n=1 Tax=Rattus norvegicus TaxID=10116 RepID=A6J8B5_RAT|nr:rCG53670 [Rattus norvegicus]